ncbi:MAG: hypothetical protein ACTIKR_00820, partial [Advenella sp.]
MNNATVKRLWTRRPVSKEGFFNFKLSMCSFVGMLAIWIALTGSGLWVPIVDPMFLPSPVAVLDTFWQLCNTGYQGN